MVPIKANAKPGLKSSAGKGVPTITAAACTPERAMRAVIKAGMGASTAALSLVCACAGFYIVTNMLQEPGTDAYLSKGKAGEQIREHLESNTNVGGKMLQIYESRAAALFDKITDSRKKFSGLIERIGAEANEDAIVGMIQQWLENDFKVTSLNQLNAKLGFATAPEAPPTDAERIKAAPDRVTKAIQSVEKLVSDKKLSEQVVARAAANAVSNPLALAKEAVTRFVMLPDADVDLLLDFAKFIDKQASALTDRLDKAEKKAAKSTPKAKAKSAATATA
jgi:hypothetical protein